MAEYLLSREDITHAIRLYHRVKDHVEFNDGHIVAQKKISIWRIKAVYWSGILLYIVFALVALLPLLILIFQVFTNPISSVSFENFIMVLLKSIIIFSGGLFLMYMGMIPDAIKYFYEFKQHQSVEKLTVSQTQNDKVE